MLRRLMIVVLTGVFGTAVTPAGAVSGRGFPPAFVPPPILMYHRIDRDHPADAVGRELTLSPTAFAAQLAYLKRSGIAGISMHQLLVRLETGAPLDHVVVLTFDDGYADQYTYALPLLRRFGDSATFFVITGTLGTPRHLTWTELARMRADGEDVAAHGVEHDDLSSMSRAQQAAQIDRSVRRLRRRLRVPADSYAYPSGRFDRTTLRLVRAAGIALAVTTDPAYVIAPENRFELVRIRVRNGWTAPQFAGAIESALVHGRIVQR